MTPAPVRAAGQRLDVLDQGIARVDVDAGVLIGEGRPVMAGGVGLQARLIHAK